MSQSPLESNNNNPDNVLPTAPQDIFNVFNELGINYTLHHHPPIFTVAEGEHLKEDIPGLHCRNLFLRDKKKNSFLVVAANETEIDLKKLPDLIDSGRLSFGSSDRLWEMLGIRPGSVNPFTIINDPDKTVKIVLDAKMMDAEIVNYHPMDNAMTVGLSPKDLLKFIEYCGHTPHIVNLEKAAP